MQAVGAGLDVRVHPVVERLEVEHAHRRRVPREVGARLGVALTELAPLERELGRRRVRRQALERARAAAAGRAGRPYELQARPRARGVSHLAQEAAEVGGAVCAPRHGRVGREGDGASRGWAARAGREGA